MKDDTATRLRSKRKVTSAGWLRSTGLLWAFLAAPPLAGQTPAGTGGDPDRARGEVLYRVHCASCHGKEGRGDGPMAPVLRVRPTDLTRLERRAGGEFPQEEVAASIDGRTKVTGHGTREMPVWGLSFAEPGRDTPQEREVDAEIRALVLHIRGLQPR